MCKSNKLSMLILITFGLISLSSVAIAAPYKIIAHGNMTCSLPTCTFSFNKGVVADYVSPKLTMLADKPIPAIVITFAGGVAAGSTCIDAGSGGGDNVKPISFCNDTSHSFILVEYYGSVSSQEIITFDNFRITYNFVGKYGMKGWVQSQGLQLGPNK